MTRDLESVIAEALQREAFREPKYLRHDTCAVLTAVREYLLSDEAVERASREFEPMTWELSGGLRAEGMRSDAMASARAALSAALGENS